MFLPVGKSGDDFILVIDEDDYPLLINGESNVNAASIRLIEGVIPYVGRVQNLNIYLKFCPVDEAKDKAERKQLRDKFLAAMSEEEVIRLNIALKQKIKKHYASARGKYRDNLYHSLKVLEAIRDKLFDTTLHVAMAGELKDFNDTVELGESYTIEKALFEACDDINVQKLTRLMTEVENTYDSIVNLNNLKTGDDYD